MKNAAIYILVALLGAHWVVLYYMNDAAKEAQGYVKTAEANARTATQLLLDRQEKWGGEVERAHSKGFGEAWTQCEIYTKELKAQVNANK
jgi:hypothetical protein